MHNRLLFLFTSSGKWRGDCSGLVALNKKVLILCLLTVYCVLMLLLCCVLCAAEWGGEACGGAGAAGGHSEWHELSPGQPDLTADGGPGESQSRAEVSQDAVRTA